MFDLQVTAQTILSIFCGITGMTTAVINQSTRDIFYKILHNGELVTSP